MRGCVSFQIKVQILAFYTDVCTTPKATFKWKLLFCLYLILLYKLTQKETTIAFSYCFFWLGKYHGFYYQQLQTTRRTTEVLS